jgi:hypothetical protein
MAKKKPTRRPNLSKETLDRARAERQGERQDSVTPVSSGTSLPKIKRAGTPISAAATRIPTHDELRQEYAHVVVDLRNLLILASVLIVLILILAVTLPHPNV